YVGVTATPFANVFINPDSKEEMLGDDLFPRNFIYALKPPTNYIGASSIYMDNSKYSEALVYIHDVDEPDEPIDRSVYTDDGSFFYKHTKEWRGILPDSLEDAIYCYFLTNVVRVLRGDGGEPMTMMINMSRFVKVQKYIQEYVSDLYDHVYNTIRIDFSDDNRENIDLPLYKSLHKCWMDHFKNIVDVEWEQVSRKINLLQGVEDVQVIVVNSSKTSGKLDYAKNKSLRAIAIGGLALSRGLTLKGLVVSYFYRNTATYDVLMQMGRWFGYRKNYDDLFRIWTSRQSAEWYRDISEATEELKDEIDKMRAAELTPNDFGLRVRDDSDDLGITARNKMRHTANHIEQLSYWGCVFDTPYLSSNPDLCKNNTKVTKDFINKLIIAGHIFQRQDIDNRKLYISQNIPALKIKLFMEQLKIHNSNIRFDTKQIAPFITEHSDTDLPRYDVVIIEGDGDEYEISGMIDKVKSVSREFDIRNERININKRSGRLTSPSDAKQGLSTRQIASAKEQAVKSGLSGVQTLPIDTWFKYVPDRNPLLMIYFIGLKSNENSPQKERGFIDEMGGELNVGFAIGFPANHSVTDVDRRLYRVNRVYEKQYNEAEGIEE
ncbi:MAG TPA: endonuclease, partial [Porphyromonadaceae bacterium]|nr:endonuclease [Porphyromonadaceae bacterium]